MHIRRAKENDLEIILAMYAHARQFMRQTGNPNQWGDIHPLQELVEKDIQLGQSYICEDAGVPVGVFAFIVGEDPTYNVIENGQWQSDAPYGTIHRLASNGRAKGVAKVCFEYCREQIPHLRVDTHEDNQVMQKAVTDFGFQYCGIIYVRDRSPRLAYEFFGDDKAIHSEN